LPAEVIATRRVPDKVTSQIEKYAGFVKQASVLGAGYN
jgi:hypothetical protein